MLYECDRRLQWIWVDFCAPRSIMRIHNKKYFMTDKIKTAKAILAIRMCNEYLWLIMFIWAAAGAFAYLHGSAESGVFYHHPMVLYGGLACAIYLMVRYLVHAIVIHFLKDDDWRVQMFARHAAEYKTLRDELRKEKAEKKVRMKRA